MANEVEFGPLSDSDRDLLAELLSADSSIPGLEFRRDGAPSGDGGLGSTGVLILAASLCPPVIAAIAAFLLKRRHVEDIHYEIDIFHADGSSAHVAFNYRQASSDAPDAEVLAALAELASSQVNLHLERGLARFTDEQVE